MLTRILVVAIIVLATLALVAMLAPGAFTGGTDGGLPLGRIALMAGSLLLVSGSLLHGIRTERWKMLQYAAIWIVIGAALAGLYTLLNPAG